MDFFWGIKQKILLKIQIKELETRLESPTHFLIMVRRLENLKKHSHLDVPFLFVCLFVLVVVSNFKA